MKIRGSTMTGTEAVAAATAKRTDLFVSETGSEARPTNVRKLPEAPSTRTQRIPSGIPRMKAARAMRENSAV